MKKSTIEIILKSDIEKVWKVITNNKDYSWRSDIFQIDIINEKQFIEYTKKGFPTTFTITEKIKNKRYSFDMENINMKGHWIGYFEKQKKGTKLTLVEEIEMKPLILKILSTIFLNIKKIQEAYIKDLRNKLGE